jgi:hypothetical protein
VRFCECHQDTVPPALTTTTLTTATIPAPSTHTTAFTAGTTSGMHRLDRIHQQKPIVWIRNPPYGKQTRLVL